MNSVIMSNTNQLFINHPDIYNIVNEYVSLDFHENQSDTYNILRLDKFGWF
jgi:hypothetical protein